MPFTIRLTSPPAWVNSTSQRRTRAIQSMFSTPLSIEIFAPADRVNHSSGTFVLLGQVKSRKNARHSGSASAPRSLLGSPSSKTRVMPSGYLSVKLRMTPTIMLAWFWP